MGKVTDIKKGHCVYWIPTISSSKETLSLIQKVHTVNYRVGEDESYRFTSKASNTDLTGAVRINLSIEALSGSSIIYKYTVRFKSICYNKDGLLSMSYSVPSDFVEDFGLLRDMVYRHIKHHFHRHVYHADEGGELINAFYPDDQDNPIDVHADNNDALKFYLTRIKDFLNVHNEYLIATWHLIQKGSKVADGKQDLSLCQRLKALISSKETDKLSDIERKLKRSYSESCQQVMDQISFFNILIYSDQNKDSHLQCAGAPVSDMRQLTREITNNINAIRVLNERAKAIFYDKTIEANEKAQQRLKSSARSSSRLGWISLILGALSLGITIWQSCNNASEKKRTDEAMKLLQEAVTTLKQSVKNDSVESAKQTISTSNLHQINNGLSKSGSSVSSDKQ